jgi:hypothetical protein
MSANCMADCARGAGDTVETLGIQVSRRTTVQKYVVRFARTRKDLCAFAPAYSLTLHKDENRWRNGGVSLQYHNKQASDHWVLCGILCALHARQAGCYYKQNE